MRTQAITGVENPTMVPRRPAKVHHLYPIRQRITDQREFFKSGRTLKRDFRREQLRLLQLLVTDNESEILEALAMDMGKPLFEGWVSEVSQVQQELVGALRNLETWSRPRPVSTSVLHFLAWSEIRPEPHGVVLIIGPWNYPFQLIMMPLVGALAAGNTAVLKPSEVTPATSALLTRLVSEYFDPQVVTVIEGDADLTQRLLKERFDYIFFTGSTRVGRLVMKAAAEHLTPVTLELGGKSPCIVDDTVDIQKTARRIVWGKFFNAGQTCLAPDYLLVERSIRDRLVAAMIDVITEFYGENPLASEDYARIINERHFDKLTSFLTSGSIMSGGHIDRERCIISPTLLEDVSLSSPIMQEEIFGPILPVIPYDYLTDALAIVQQYPRPLALYFFSRDKKAQQRVLRETESGGVCINDTVVQFSNSHLPFGGTGDSGMGSYHGKATFDAFSHQRSIMKKSFLLDLPFRYPPYADKFGFVKRLIRAVTWLNI